MATAAGFETTRLAEIDIVVSEITSNLTKHADGGELFVRIAEEDNQPYIEIVCIDDGPGISDMAKVLADGYSSTATLGHGLGSIRRLSHTFDIYSQKSWGTILLSRIYKMAPPTFRKNKFDFKALNIPKSGEHVSGDGFCFQQITDGFRLLLADGLGHGAEANRAVKEACRVFPTITEISPADILRSLHNSIRKTRGVVAIVLTYSKSKREWCIAGVGNISFKWQDRANFKSYTSYNGIVGHNIPNTINDVTVSQDEFAQFIACSDGITSRWDISRFPMINRHDGMILAAAIYKEFNRGTDDSSVFVYKSN